MWPTRVIITSRRIYQSGCLNFLVFMEIFRNFFRIWGRPFHYFCDCLEFASEFQHHCTRSWIMNSYERNWVHLVRKKRGNHLVRSDQSFWSLLGHQITVDPGFLRHPDLFLWFSVIYRRFDQSKFRSATSKPQVDLCKTLLLCLVTYHQIHSELWHWLAVLTDLSIFLNPLLIVLASGIFSEVWIGCIFLHCLLICRLSGYKSDTTIELFTANYC